MISRIRMRIFIPVLVVIIIFPLLSWGIFSSTSGWYMNRLSRKSLSFLMNSIVSTAETLYSGSDDRDRADEKDLSKELMNQVKSFIRKDRPEAQLLTMNSRMKLTYPKSGNEQPDTQALYQVCRETVYNGTLSGDGSGVEEVSVGGTRYLLSMYEAESSGNVRNKYMFGYVAVPDTRALISYTGTLLLLIAGILCLLSLVAVWFIAGGISKPLQALCRHTHAIGKGNFSPIDERSSIREIEELRCSFNRMSEDLERMNRQQNVFFQNASHELRTPLMSICGYAQGIQCNVFPDHNEAAGVILTESMRMKELVDGILTISKMDSRCLALEKTCMDLNDFMKNEMTALRGMELMEHIRLEAIPLREKITVSADPALLSKAFRNVISNCVRYASEKVTSEISVNDGWVHIVITDDGQGFDEEDLPHVFDRFYKGPGGNFGIGLSIVRTAMEYMGGRAEACNAESPVHGARFVLSLPLDCVYPGTASRSASPVTPVDSFTE